ncbi:MAG: DUF4199 domain-containing protein [Robiginitalea sp.]
MMRFTLPVRFGLAASGSLIAYFLILSLFDLHTNVFYSLFNGVITGFGIFEAIKYYKLELGDEFTYGKGFAAGITVGFVATIIFTIFFAFYSTEVNQDFLPNLSTTFFKDFKSFEAIVFLTVAVMGFATSLVLTLTFMQLFKPSYNPKKTS